MRPCRKPHMLVALLVVSLAACATPRPPELPFTAAVPSGVVHASNSENAQRIADLLKELSIAVHSALPGGEAQRVDVRLVAKMEHENWGGATYTTGAGHWIELPDVEPNDRWKATLVHELVHFQLGPDWSTLPGVLEEGLCDAIAQRVVPSVAALERAEYAVMLATAVDGGLRFQAPMIRGHGSSASFGAELANYSVNAPIEFDELPTFEQALRYESSDLEPIRARGVRGVLDALGYTLVSRIGVERLHELCLRAKILRLHIVPYGWLYQAAGIDPRDRTTWRSAVRDLFGDAEKLALLRRDSVEFRSAHGAR